MVESNLHDVTVGWFPVVTFIGGILTSYLTQFLQHRQMLQRERESRREARRERLADRRTAFQRKTLLDLQEAVQDLVRATGVASHQDELSYRQTGQRKKRLEEVGQQDLLANRRLILLGVRVRDQLLRGLINQLRDKDADLLLLILEPEFERLQAMTSLAELAGQIHERVGELLRTMDDEEEESTVERN